jgi:acyl-coenzyme A thioesterase PaaI-like protein
MTEMTVAEAQAFLAENFAPWINEMDLRFEEIGGGRVLVRIPFSPRLNRLGDIMCGQAMMAAADTAMVFAAISAIGGFSDMATVSQNTSFFRAAAAGDVLCDVRVVKQGRSLLFGDAVLYEDGKPDKPIAQATMTYALVPPRQ